MKRSITLQGFLLFFVALLSLPRIGQAAEQAQEFLNELRARRFFDEALDYLDQAQGSSLVPAAFKESVPYERGVTLVKSAFLIKDARLREVRLDEAQDLFRELIKQTSKHAKLGIAKNELANLLVQRAGLRVERVTRVETDEQRQALRTEARGMFEESLKLFGEVEAEVRGKLEAFPKAIAPRAPGGIALITERDQLRADYLQVQLLKAAVREEMAETEFKGGMARDEILLAAAKEYKEIYEKYRTRLAGLYARLFQGRCFQKMNKYDDALDCFANLLDQPDQPREFRDIKVRTLFLAGQCWFAKVPHKYDDAIKYIGPLLETIRPEEKLDSDLLTLHLWLGKAHQTRAIDLMARDPDNRVEIKKSFDSAKKHVGIVAEHPSEVQNEAQELLAKLPKD